MLAVKLNITVMLLLALALVVIPDAEAWIKAVSIILIILNAYHLGKYYNK